MLIFEEWEALIIARAREPYDASCFLYQGERCRSVTATGHSTRLAVKNAWVKAFKDRGRVDRSVVHRRAVRNTGSLSAGYINCDWGGNFVGLTEV